MEGMDSVRRLIRPGDWMVKLDLKDAYLSVPVCLEHQPLLCFRWRDICSQFTCLALSFSCSSTFTKLLKPVNRALHRKEIRLVIYLDDIVFMNESREGVIADVSTAIDLVFSLGFLINWEKSVLLPSQSLEFLVFHGPTIPPTTIPPTIPFSQAHYRHLQRLYPYHSKFFNYDLSRYVSLSSSARDDIRWLVKHLSSSNGLCFLKKDPDLVIYSDASLHGWGFVCDGINLILDNSTAVSYLNKRGGTRSRALCDISSSIVS
ncbi:Uncharacterized protein APZ42_005622 [Daphnia magna]|uniref:Reverse transcriptase domain-containing protein n=1 Tax=Daphnia magna TaxID=35525 RepID=A0A164GCL1_9CRUS|nr:Uncharacterized protein APZ42_005622 [Daphnia magna]